MLRARGDLLFGPSQRLVQLDEADVDGSMAVELLQWLKNMPIGVDLTNTELYRLWLGFSVASA